MSCRHRRETRVGGKRALADFDLEARRRAIRLGHAELHVALMSLVSATVQVALSPRE